MTTDRPRLTLPGDKPKMPGLKPTPVVPGRIVPITRREPDPMPDATEYLGRSGHLPAVERDDKGGEESGPLLILALVYEIQRCVAMIDGGVNPAFRTRVHYSLSQASNALERNDEDKMRVALEALQSLS